MGPALPWSGEPAALALRVYSDASAVLGAGPSHLSRVVEVGGRVEVIGVVGTRVELALGGEEEVVVVVAR